ncbi:eukaryotic translation initiation factor 4 gamma-like [Lathyrus oleraceus]|uniref:eukaryotic translation initiation factor 4 gamma-like n=1 Tax=Pisum sativum TaxID=3888 RepID=UPI0021D264E7|nr:eukaryotic translation initiation factor 4 gamma-like [Pisum sativum]
MLFEKLEVLCELLVDFNNLKRNTIDLTEELEKQGWGNYFKRLHGPVYTFLVKEFLRGAKERLEVRLVHEAKERAKKEAEEKARQEAKEKAGKKAEEKAANEAATAEAKASTEEATHVAAEEATKTTEVALTRVFLQDISEQGKLNQYLRNKQSNLRNSGKKLSNPENPYDIKKI